MHGSELFSRVDKARGKAGMTARDYDRVPRVEDSSWPHPLQMWCSVLRPHVVILFHDECLESQHSEGHNRLLRVQGQP